jgi:hypothetical protein
MIEVGLVLGHLEAFLDRPPGARDPDQFLQASVGRTETQGVSDVAGVTDGSAGRPIPIPRSVASVWGVCGREGHGAVAMNTYRLTL